MRDDQEKYYVWEFIPLDSERHPPPMLARVGDLKGQDFEAGRSITADLPRVDFIVHPQRTLLDYQLNVPGLPLVSGALLEALAGEGVDNIEYFAAGLVTKAGKVLRDDYRLANVVGTVACFDWDKSKYDERYRARGVAGRIEELVLDTRKIDGQRLFRMAEAPRILLGADGVRRALESRGIRGIAFTEPADYEG